MKKFLLLVRKAFKVIFKALFWFLEVLVPRNKKKWIFGAWFGERYSDNSRSMYEYVLREMPDIKALWVTKNKEVFSRIKSEGKPVAYLNSIRGVIFALTAKVAFLTVSDDEVNGYFLNGAKKIRLWHGMPMKYIGADKRRFENGPSADNPSFAQRFKRNVFFPYYVEKTHSVLITGEFFRSIFKSSFCVPDEKIWDDGYPRNDEFFSSVTENLISEYREKFPTAKFIIYMPTHRVLGLSGDPFSPFDGFEFNPDKFFDTLEKGDYVFFYKGHFFDRSASVNMMNDRFVRVSDSQFDSLYCLIKDMDILITDYSSIYFDFLITRKPIILAPFDIDDYISTKRPLYFDYNILDAVRTYNWNELLDVLMNNKYYNPTDEEVSKYITYCDGNSSKRIAEHTLKTL